MDENPDILVGQHLTKEFSNGKKTVLKAVDDVSFSFKSGEILSIVGESGSGKSTVAKMILGLLKPTAGEIYFDGKSRDLKSSKARRKYWQNVQLVFQDPFSSFNIFDKIDRVLLDCIRLMGKNNASRSEKFDMMKEACESVNMKFEELTNKYPFELSGGQMQRLMLARIFMLKPKLVIADEPTSMIDACSRASILNSLLKLHDETKLTIVFITHDIGLAYYISDRIYIMEHGKFVENGLPDDVILKPSNDYTKHLISDVPKIEKQWSFD